MAQSFDKSVGRPIELPHSFQGAERVEPGKRVRCGEGGFMEGRDQLRTATLPKQHLLRLVPHPTIRRVELCDEFARIERGKAGNQTRDGAAPGNSIDSTHVVAESVVGEQFVFSVLREPVRVLDHVAVHVGDPEGAVGSGTDHDGAAPAVFACEKVGRFFVIALLPDPLRGKGHSVRAEGELLHEIVKRFGDEGHRFSFGKEVAVAVNHAAAGGGVAARLLEAVVAFLGRTRRKDRRV